MVHTFGTPPLVRGKARGRGLCRSGGQVVQFLIVSGKSLSVRLFLGLGDHDVSLF
jgi:hypothetical protein